MIGKNTYSQPMQKNVQQLNHIIRLEDIITNIQVLGADQFVNSGQFCISPVCQRSGSLFGSVQNSGQHFGQELNAVHWVEIYGVVGRVLAENLLQLVECPLQWMDHICRPLACDLGVGAQSIQVLKKKYLKNFN